MPGIALVVLSYNSAQVLERCLASAKAVVDSFLVVDSYSTDDSPEIARANGARVLQRPFSNYADQRNWACTQIDPTADWVFHLDSDEFLTPSLAAELAARVPTARSEVAGFLMRRRVRFLGRDMRFGGLGATWHLRLYRTGRGACEDRLYDQHFVVSGRVERLREFFVDDNESNLEVWTDRHNRWSSAEAEEAGRTTGGRVRVPPSLTGSPITRKRWMKENLWNRLPRLWRAFLYFGYRYFVRLGFLDGREGLIFHTLQGFWFRFLVDGKIYERAHPSQLRRSNARRAVR
jgi:glycosyltransferase involved in cell wall biosynthesis